MIDFNLPDVCYPELFVVQLGYEHVNQSGCSLPIILSSATEFTGASLWLCSSLKMFGLLIFLSKIKSLQSFVCEKLLYVSHK